MDLLESILTAKGGGAVAQLANQFGLGQDQATSAIQSILPALAGGLQRNISQGGLDDLLGALSNGQHQRYIDDPSTLNPEQVRDEGNGILGHVLGSKDVSRQVAAEASGRTGISESVLKQMLPAVAAMAMGALSKGMQSSTAAATGTTGASSASTAGFGGSDILGMLAPLLGGGGTTSTAEGILGTVSRFFKK